MSRDFDSDVVCATEPSLGSQPFVVSIDRPPIPARPRRCVSATRRSLFAVVHSPVSSWLANVIGLPSRDIADEVTVSMRPSVPTRANSSPTRMNSDSGPCFTMFRSGRYTLSTWSSAVATSWISGVGHGVPIGSPASYWYHQPQPQPWSEHRYTSPPTAHPANTTGPAASASVMVADHGPLPVFCGATIWLRR